MTLRHHWPMKITQIAALIGTLCAIVPASAVAAKPPGVDVSRFNGAIDWVQVRGAGFSIRLRRGQPRQRARLHREAAAVRRRPVLRDQLRRGPHRRGRVGAYQPRLRRPGRPTPRPGPTRWPRPTCSSPRSALFTRRPPPRARRRVAVRRPHAEPSPALGPHLGQARPRRARGEADHLHQHDQLGRDRQHDAVRWRPPALDSQLRRPQAERPGRQLGRSRLVGVAVHGSGRVPGILGKVDEDRLAVGLGRLAGPCRFRKGFALPRRLRVRGSQGGPSPPRGASPLTGAPGG